MKHSDGFLRIVDEARPRVREIGIAETRQRLDANPNAALVDVREDREWEQGHVANAVHLGKGVLERDIDQTLPDRDQEILIYCGGGYRSVLAADVAQRMGYRNVASIQGGYKAMVAEGWPIEQGSTV